MAGVPKKTEMGNNYVIDGLHTYIFLNRKGKLIETIIETADLEKAKSFEGTWYASYCKKQDCFYVHGNYPRGSGRRTTSLHRWLHDNPSGLQIDHINHDTLDNRRSNLRATTRAGNLQNRKGPTKANKSGFLGVSWNEQSQKWRAQAKINGKYIINRLFSDVHEAREAVLVAKKALEE